MEHSDELVEPVTLPLPLWWIVTPFPRWRYAELWKMLHQFPEANFDDSSPESFEEFEAFMIERAKSEICFAVVDPLEGPARERRLLGAVSVARLTNRIACLHGICFDRSLHGTSIPRDVVSELLRWKDQWRTIYAGYYQHNQRVARFLEKLGFVPAGPDSGLRFAESVTQNGKPVKIEVVRYRSM